MLEKKLFVMNTFVASLATKILSRYLGDYVEGLDSKNLEISLLSGSVELKNLKLKASTLEKLDLPITVKEGGLNTIPVLTVRFFRSPTFANTLEKSVR